MAPKKQSIISDGTTSKGKFIATIGGITLSSSLNLSPIVKETVSALSQGAARDIHPPSMHESQLL